MKSLSKTEIRALYGVAPGHGDFTVFGRAVKNAISSSRRSQMAADLKTMSQSEWREKYRDEIVRFKGTPSSPALESQVTELTF